MAKKDEYVEFGPVIDWGCGIDIHKKVLVATVRSRGVKEEARSFDSFTENIKELREWLTKKQIKHIAMESTGVYWKRVYNILEEDFKVLLVNASHFKNIPCQKTDNKDSKRIIKLLLSGLLKGSFIPPRSVRNLLGITRYKRKIVNQIAWEKSRIHKFLEDANIRLSSVVSNLSGATATKIIDAMIGGKEVIAELVKPRHGKMKSRIEDLAKVLTYKLTNHHRFCLVWQKDQYRIKRL